MKEPTEVIKKVHFHIGQQFGTSVKNSVDALKDKAKMEWHVHGVKITFNGVTRVCSMATVHGVDCVDSVVDVVAQPEVIRRSPGRPPAKEVTN